MMSSSQSNQPRWGCTRASSTSVLGRLASAAFSRAMLRALLGMSIESRVKAIPEDSKVPEVSLVRSNYTLEHPATIARSAASSPCAGSAAIGDAVERAMGAT